MAVTDWAQIFQEIEVGDWQHDQIVVAAGRVMLIPSLKMSALLDGNPMRKH